MKIKTARRPPDDRSNGRSSSAIRASRMIFAAATVFSVAMLASVTVFDIADDALALTRHDKSRIEISVNELTELPDELYKAGIIRHPRIFSMYLSLKNRPLARGSAAVSGDMDYRALLGAFVDEPAVRTVRIRFPKTSSVTDIIDIFLANGIGTREGFVNAINTYPFEFDFVNAIPSDNGRLFRLEGYLFPDTYDFYTGRSESYYIGRMLERFEDVMSELSPQCLEAGMSLDEALTVASLIECSAGFSSGYERMSSVIHNRLNEGLPISIPASSVYGLSARSGLFTGEPTDDLYECDSPYNTLINKGLPPGAICSPTREALLCAIYPEKSQYLYFVTRSNGNVLFAQTLSEHRENLASR